MQYVNQFFIFSLTELIFENDLTKTLLIMADKAKMVAQSRTVLQVKKENHTMVVVKQARDSDSLEVFKVLTF